VLLDIPLKVSIMPLVQLSGGAPMSIPIIRCAACQAPMRRGLALCPKCRHPVGDPPPSSRPPEPELVSTPSQPVEPVETARFCQQCGQALTPAARFCSHCGAARASHEQSASIPVPEVSGWTEPATHWRQPGWWVMFVAVIGLLGFVGGTLFAAPIAIFGAAPAFWTWQMDYPPKVKSAMLSLALSYIGAGLTNWFFLGGVGIIRFAAWVYG
jgi:hypothetical protein